MADSLTQVTTSPAGGADGAMVALTPAPGPLEVALALFARQGAAADQEQTRTLRAFEQLTLSMQDSSRVQAEEMQQLKALVATLRTRVEASDAAHAKTVAEYRAGMEALKQTIAAQTKVIEGQGRTIQQLAAEVTALKGAVDVLQRTEYQLATVPITHNPLPAGCMVIKSVCAGDWSTLGFRSYPLGSTGPSSSEGHLILRKSTK